ncbi:transglutaminase-like domain-containing protein [Aurantiacibacter gangjinensis]|uniref:Transglutaminase n=1 Tax=Aurantiacibacter gangjinensis TaxID=502682 RepID=A0A0G9MNZ8_9SPHN|nr:transglutaminase family protein [Aurantiacibacter gangjinensis]APE29394.1 Transglutaminase-like [Aurantiacibacter gangjinensis]KLE31038.1 transglutaminase [Aurantiacibacter gangjinensis]
MPIDINARFAFHLDQPTDLLLQFEAAAIPEQRILSSDTQLSDAMHIARVPAQDAIGERIWVRAEGDYSVQYTAQVEVDRISPDLGSLDRLDPHDLPGETVEYLFDSRYCQADRMQSFVADRFGGLEGGAKVVAMCQWIADNFTYTPGASNATTTALDSFVERRGICRDYAHVLITFARASTIPARYVSCYAPGVEPPDFHAVAEVFLKDPTIEGGGAWYIVDATGMADPAKTVKIGIGRDAADVSFLTSFGMNDFQSSSVEVSESN